MDSDDADAQATASFVRDKPRSRLDDVSFYDDGKTRDSAEARASDRRRPVAARPPAGGRGVDRWAEQADSDEDSRDAARPPAKRARVGAPPRRSPHFSPELRSGGRDAADAIDVEDEPRVVVVDDVVDDGRAPAPAPRADRFRAPERRSTRFLEEPAAPRRNPRRGEERVMLRCRRVYFGTALRRDVAVVFAPSCVTMEWRSDTSGLYIEARLAPSHMTSFDMYHGPTRGAGGDGEANPINLADDDEMAPDAIRDFFAVGLRQKPPHLRSVDGFEPTDDEGPRKYVVVVLDGDALATFKREAVPAVVWGGHVGWPAAPVLGTPAAARPFLEGVPIADALAAGDAAEDAAALRQKPSRAPRRGRVARSVVDVEAEDPDAALPAFVYPRPDAPDAITLVRGDRGRLDDGEFLNDNLINLYLRHRTRAAAPPLNAHVFSTFFFTKLSEAPRHASGEAYEKVKSWCRGVDLFAKDALFVPVNEHLHWSLAVVLRPGAAAPPASGAVVDLAASSDDDAAAAAAEAPTPAGPCVLVMDSLRSHDASRIAAYVRSFLRAAWADRPGAPGCDRRFEEASMPVVLPDLPRQRNSFDCGVYVLKFFDLLYGRSPPVRAGGRDTTFSGQFAKNLFARADVLAERKQLAAFFDDRAAAAAGAPAARDPPRARLDAETEVDSRAGASNRDVAADLAAAMPEAQARQRRDVARSAPPPPPAAAVDLTAAATTQEAHPPGRIPAGFVVPPVRQSYKQRAHRPDA